MPDAKGGKERKLGGRTLPLAGKDWNGPPFSHVISMCSNYGRERNSISTIVSKLF
jgi:hypothetical protein